MNDSQVRGKIRASQIIDAPVRLINGDDFGSVAELVVDAVSLNVESVIIRRDGALTATDNFYRMSWSSLEYHLTDNSFTLTVSEDEVDELPAASSLSRLI